MYSTLSHTIQKLDWTNLKSAVRKATLQPLINFIQQKVNDKEPVNLNFICTHNSRRSHLAQVWAQVAASYFNISNVNCYSGGTEMTALYPKIIDILVAQGFMVAKIADGTNPIYAIKYDDTALPIVGFSKIHDNVFNPTSEFAAIMTCSRADQGCPFIPGAQTRIPVTFEDPKISDNTPEQAQVYSERSLEIASELFYVFSKIQVI